MDPILSNITLRDAGTALLDLAMPRRCIVCRRPLGLRERFICLDCTADFPFTHYWERSHNPMADKFNALIQQDLDAASPTAPSLSGPLPGPADSVSNPSGLPPCPSEPLPTSSEFPPGPSEPLPFPADSSCPSLDLAGADSQVLCPQGGPVPSPEMIIRRHEPYAFAAALFFYNADSDYRHIPWHLKYEGGLAAGRFFAHMLGTRLAASAQFADVDVVIPVPLHWTRRWRRGYNQAEIIARELASALGAELRTDILRRSRRTRSQVRLSLEDKAANVRGAFRPHVPPKTAPTCGKCPHVPPEIASTCGKCPHVPPEIASTCGKTPAGSPTKPGDLRAAHVLLVDDTFTTGSTLNACRVALRQVFPLPTRISVATLAYVSSE